MNVFLGGTCGKSTWRNELIPFLQSNDITFFNPVVEDWTPECQELELKERSKADLTLFMITQEMEGVFSIAEAVDDAWRKDGEVIFSYKKKGFSASQIKSLDAVGKLIERAGGTFLPDPDYYELARCIWELLRE